MDSIRTWGGAEVWFLETAHALIAAGHRAGIVAQPDSELRRRAEDAGVPCAAIPIRFDAAPWTLCKLTRHFRRAGVTAVVANLTKDLKAAAVAGRLAGVPIILGSRESDFPLKRKAYYRWYFTRLATGLLVNSEATRHTVSASAPWLDPANVHLLYKGIDLERFRPAPAIGNTDSRAPVVGFVGQLILRKGIRELMVAWSRIDARQPTDPPLLRLAGEGPMRAEIETWRDGLRRPDAVEVCGFVEDLTSFYRDCALLVMPSHSEGFGLAAAEAAACGLPVVAADASSLPEIVVHEETGLLVPPGDPAALAEAVLALLADPQWAAALGRAGSARIAERFPRRATLDRLLDLTGGSKTATQEGAPKC